MKKRISVFVILVMSLFLIGSVSAQGCESTGWKGLAKLYDEKEVCITCPTCDYVNISLTDPEGVLIFSNQEMNESNNLFCYQFSGDIIDKIGTYQIEGFSQLDIPLGLCFDATLSGKVQSIWAYIMGIVFSISLLLGIIWLNIRFPEEERDKLYNKLVSEYFKIKSSRNKGNLAYAILYTIAYGILSMFFVLYYISILIIMFVFSDMASSFGLNTFSGLMPQLISIMLKGLVVIFVVFIAIFYKIIRDLLNSSTEMFRGIYNER